MTDLIKIIKELTTMGLFISFSAFFFGIKFPDWDFKMKLPHRNILTHSPLLLVLFVWLYTIRPTTLFRFFIVGFSLGLALHLIFDYFPRGWGGGALLHIPFKKRALPKSLTKLLFFVFIIYTIANLVFFIKTFNLYIFFGGVAIIVIFKDAIKEEKFFRPFFIFYFWYFLFGLLFHNYLRSSILSIIRYIAMEFHRFF